MPAAPIGNLPTEVTSFVGRRNELASAKRALSASRVLTLCGPGGVGKTRLALRVADHLHRAFSDGVWFTELAALQRGDLVAQAVAADLGLRSESTDSVAALVEHLRDKQLLLVLDNCEHLVTACAQLVSKIVTAAPRVRVLATSREVLGVEGERVLAVPPLSVPTDDGLGHAAPSEAVMLFTERASAAAGFELTDENSALVARICRRLDGIPLALELAAVRLRAVPLAEIVRRLDDALGLLTTGSRTAPQRQQTLQAAIDWSYDLCSEDEQLLWQRLSVFAGGFTLDAAEQVCTGGPIAAHKILDLTSGLVDKSVVGRIDTLVSASDRYSMLEVLRQYGLTRLAHAGEEQSLRLRHRDFFARLMQRGRTEYISPRDVEWFRDVDMELANVRAALGFSLTVVGQAERTVEMATSMHHYWTHTAGTTREGFNWLVSALEQYTKPTTIRVRGLTAASKLASILGEFERGSQFRDEARPLAESIGSEELLGEVVASSAMLAWLEGDFSTAMAVAEEGARLALAAGDPITEAECRVIAAAVTLELRVPRSPGICANALQATESRGAHLLRAAAHWANGLLCWQDGNLHDARDHLAKSISLFRMFGRSYMTAMAIEGVACVAVSDQDYTRAATLLGAVNRIWQTSGTALPPVVNQRITEKAQAKVRSALGESAFEAASQSGAELSHDAVLDLALGRTGEGPRRHATPARQPGGLTKREHEVARLVADGMTNREIAQYLVISQRTAETHVEHILVKLGFTSRAQIAAWLAQDAADVTTAGRGA